MVIVNLFRGLFVLILILFLTPLASLVTFVAIFFFRWTPVKVAVFPRIWARCILAASGVSVAVEEKEPLDVEQPYIFAANHQSQFDIFALQGYFKTDFRWLAKKELFRIPLFGPAMRKAGHISIDRSHGRKALLSLKKAAKRISDGTSVIIFPEGTRSRDGRLRPFKPGGMYLAIKAGVPLVPVAIMGTHEILAKGKCMVRPGRIVILVGKPIDTRGVTLKQKQELAETVHQAVAELMMTAEEKMAAKSFPEAGLTKDQ